MVERTLTIIGRLGLHARAAAKLVRVTNEFQSEVSLRRAGFDARVLHRDVRKATRQR